MAAKALSQLDAGKESILDVDAVVVNVREKLGKVYGHYKAVVVLCSLYRSLSKRSACAITATIRANRDNNMITASLGLAILPRPSH